MCEITLTLVKPVQGQPLTEAEQVTIECSTEHSFDVLDHTYTLPEGFLFPDGRNKYREFSSRNVILYWPCFHKNYGSLDDPSSVWGESNEYLCATCDYLYCDSCNYGNHRCYGCGDYIDHDSSDHPANCWEW